MKFKRWYIGLIFLLTLSLRLFYAFQSPTFSDDEAYFTIRQVQHIRETGLPIFHDELSYSGRTLMFAPLYYYALAFFSFFMPIDYMGKIIPNIFASCLVFVVYLVAKEISKNKKAALFSAFIGGFIPIFFSSTINSISVYSFVFPAMFYMIYCFLKIEQKKYVYLFLALLFILALTSSIVVLLLLSLLVFLLLLKIENMEPTKKEIEVTIFSILLFVWLEFIVYKKVFLFHGPGVIWQNIPTQIFSLYFTEANIISIIYLIGTIPMIYGAYSIYQHIFNTKERKTYLLIGFVFVSAFLLWLRLITLELGLIYLGVTMSILFSEFYRGSFRYIKKTRFSKFRLILWLSFFAVLIISAILPSLYYSSMTMEKSISWEETDALEWLQDNTPKNSVVLSTPNEGHLVSSIAKRKNVADSNYLLIKDIDVVFEDIKKIFTTPYETEAISLLEKYNVDYIYYSFNAKRLFDVKEISFIKDKRCFKEVYANKKVKIFESLCKIE